MKKENRKQRQIICRIVGIAVFALLLVILNYPSVLFFLSASQIEAISEFNTLYFGRYVPIQTESGGFDFLKIPTLLFAVGCLWACYSLVKLLVGVIPARNRRAETVKGLFLNVVRYAVWIFGIILGLGMLGADVLTVIAGLGILALIIGFGAQSLIEDVFAGLFIIFEGRFYVGDIISVDGFRGTVESIGVVSTQIKDAGGNIRIINNSDIRTMTNLSEVTSLAVSVVSIAYGADLLRAEQTVNELCEKLPAMYPAFFPVKPKYLGVENLGESSVDLKVVADVSEQNIYQARRILNRELKLALDRAGVEIPFPQVTVWYGNTGKKGE